MEASVLGRTSQIVPKHAAMGQEAEQELAPTLHPNMGAETARGNLKNSKIVIVFPVRLTEDTRSGLTIASALRHVE
jgi:hypothetical protein